MNTWTDYATLPGQITETFYNGRHCVHLLAINGAPPGPWGGVRCQKRDDEFHVPGHVWSHKFAFLIPSDWLMDFQRPDSIADLHQYQAEGATPWQLNLKGDLLMLNSPFSERFTSWSMQIKAEVWYDLEIEYLPAVDATGWFRLRVNGATVHTLDNVQTQYPDRKGNYFKVGPYMMKRGTMPAYRRMYAQI